MQSFIILSLAFAVVSVGMVVVAVVALRRSVKDLTDAGRQASERIAPLAEELQAEQAVTQLEVEALQRRSENRSGVRYP
jgi:hypothetical protein